MHIFTIKRGGAAQNRQRLKRTSLSFGAKPLSLSLSKAIVSSSPRESLRLALSISFQN
jgi:hypothetical protein